MIAWYALGAGLGHLTRLQAARHTLGIDEEIVLLTSSSFAADSRVCGPVSVHYVEADAGSAIRELAPDRLVLDAFPAGLHGELTASTVPAGLPVTHLARLLRWDVYRALLPADPLPLNETWLIEPVADEHLRYLTGTSARVASLDLVEPPAAGPGAGSVAGVEPGSWLIVHSGPESEVRELLGYARETAVLEGESAPLVVITPLRLDLDVPVLDVYPAWPLFAAAARIITAAGCNVVRQLAPWRDKHRMVPFPRRYDDQFARATRARHA